VELSVLIGEQAYLTRTKQAKQDPISINFFE